MREYQGVKKAAERRTGRDREWIEAVKGGNPSPGRFENVSACAESICLGAVALKAGRKIAWNSKNMKITNIPEANELLYRKYRKGWEL